MKPSWEQTQRLLSLSETTTLPSISTVINLPSIRFIKTVVSFV